LFGFRVDCYLILLFGRTLTVCILVNPPKEIFVLGLVDELAPVVETNAIMGTDLIDDCGREMIADAMDLSR
jgi:hypothetical protein